MMRSAWFGDRVARLLTLAEQLNRCDGWWTVVEVVANRGGAHAARGAAREVSYATAQRTSCMVRSN